MDKILPKRRPLSYDQTFASGSLLPTDLTDISTVDNAANDILVEYCHELTSSVSDNKTWSLHLLETYGDLVTHMHNPAQLSCSINKIVTNIRWLHSQRPLECGSEFTGPNIDFKLSLMNTLQAVIKSIHEAGIDAAFHLAGKRTLIRMMMDFIEEEPADALVSDIRWRALQIITSLSKLQPPLNKSDTNILLKTILGGFFRLPSLEELMVKGDPEMTKDLYKKTLKEMTELLKNIFFHQKHHGLINIFYHLTTWLCPDRNPFHWEAAIEMTMNLLNHYTTTIKPNVTSPGNIRWWINHFAPSVSELQENICVSNFIEMGKDVNISHQSDATDLTAEQFGLCVDGHKIMDFVTKIVTNISSENELKTSMSSYLLSSVLSIIGHGLHEQVADIFHTIAAEVKYIRSDDVHKAVLGALRVLTVQHPLKMTYTLLQGHDLSSSDIRLLWRSVPESSASTQLVLNTLMDNMEQAANRQQVISAVQEILLALKDPEWLCSISPRLLCELLKTIITSTGDNSEAPQTTADPPTDKLCVLAMETMKLALERCKDHLEEQCAINSNWYELLQCPQTFSTGLTLLTKSIAMSGEQYQQQLAKISKDLLQQLQDADPARNISAMAFFTEMLCYPKLMNNKTQKYILLCMAGNNTTCNSIQRRLAVRALGNATQAAPKYVTKYKNLLMTDLMDGLYEPADENIVDEALISASKLVKFYKIKGLKRVPEIILQCRAFLDDDNKSIQQHAVLLLGEIARYSKVQPKGFIQEQLKCCLGSLCKNLCSDDPEMVSASMYTLHYCIPHVGLQVFPHQLQLHSMHQLDSHLLLYAATCW